jgi:hypothetical protein
MWHTCPAIQLNKVKYKEVAPYVSLDPSREGSDILPLKTFRSRIPADLFGEICMDVAMEQYGRLEEHQNEEARNRFITSLFSRIVSLFGHAVINNPEGLLESEFAKKGWIKHHFIAMQSVGIVFIEVKKTMFVGKGRRLDVIG